ncbi:Fic family protein, partial [Candidatus Parcubacteria bacterium]|nr:Fic family protein [Candidatus Parcubacteria bacterium]
TVILKNDRKKYYQTLDLAHKGEIESFVDFIGRNVERSLTWYLEAVVPGKEKKRADKWQILSELAEKTPYSQEYLSLLARRGKIEAVKKERNWYSNMKAIKRYLEGVK